jgi:hypothetical protein
MDKLSPVWSVVAGGIFAADAAAYRVRETWIEARYEEGRQAVRRERRRDLYAFSNHQLERFGSLVSVPCERPAQSPTEPVNPAHEGDDPLERFLVLVGRGLSKWATDLRTLLRIVWIVLDRVHRPMSAAPRSDIRHSPLAGATPWPGDQSGSIGLAVDPTEVRRWTMEFLRGNPAT